MGSAGFSIPLTLVIYSALAVVVAALASPARIGRLLAGLLGACWLVLPLLVDAPAAVRFFVALAVILPVLRTIDLVREPLPGWRRRVFHLLAVFDTRLATSGPRTFHGRLALGALPWLAVAAASTWVAAVTAAELRDPAHHAVRWLFGAVAFLCSFEAIARLVPFVWGLAGVRTPPLHDAPWRSRSLREFWGERWNKVVGGWLRLTIFEPLRTPVSPALASAATFTFSGLIHWYLIAVSLDLGSSLLMAGFFVAQAPLLALERVLNVRRWPEAAARAWTISAVVVPSPLFLEPMLRLLDPLAGG